MKIIPSLSLHGKQLARTYATNAPKYQTATIWYEFPKALLVEYEQRLMVLRSNKPSFVPRQFWGYWVDAYWQTSSELGLERLRFDTQFPLAIPLDAINITTVEQALRDLALFHKPPIGLLKNCAQ